MGDRVGNLFAGEVSLQLVDILPQGLNLLMLRLGNPPCEQLDAGSVFRKVRGDLLAEKRVRQMRDGQAALDGIVIGERDEIHPLRAKLVVERDGVRAAVGEIELLKEPFRRAVAGAAMEM